VIRKVAAPGSAGRSLVKPFEPRRPGGQVEREQPTTDDHFRRERPASGHFLASRVSGARLRLDGWKCTLTPLPVITPAYHRVRQPALRYKYKWSARSAAAYRRLVRFQPSDRSEIPRPRARGAIPTPPRPPPDRPARTRTQAPLARIARPGAVFGSHLARPRDRGPGVSPHRGVRVP
jgi:hypothetical protein